MTMWYVQQQGTAVGPVDIAGMSQLHTEGRLKPDSLVCKVGEASWSRASSRAELAHHFGTGAAAPPLSSAAPPRLTVEWDVRRTATAHRKMLLLFVASIPVTVVFLATLGFPLINLVVSLINLSLSVGLIIYLCKALTAMRTNVGLIVLSAILLVAPCINIVALLVLSQVIQSRLKSVGLRCGLLGVTEPKLSAAGF
jgi:hypothetical protein